MFALIAAGGVVLSIEEDVLSVSRDIGVRVTARWVITSLAEGLGVSMTARGVKTSFAGGLGVPMTAKVDSFCI